MRLLLFLFLFSVMACRKDAPVPPEPAPLNLQSVAKTIDFKLGTAYFYADAFGDTIGQIQFFPDTTISETFDGEAYIYKYRLTTNNDPAALVAHFEIADKSTTPAVIPAPITQCGNHESFQISNTGSIVIIRGFESYGSAESVFHLLK